MESDIRRDIRKDPFTGKMTINLLGLNAQLYDSQVGTRGKEIDSFPHDNPVVSVRTPETPLLLLEADPVGEGDGVYDREPSFGVDERFIVNGFNAKSLEHLVWAMIARINALRTDTGHRDDLRQFYPYIANHPSREFETETLVGRLLASRIVVPTIAEEITKAKDYFNLHPGNRCLYCNIVAEEKKKFGTIESRVVFLSEHYIGIVPFAPSNPFTVNIYPLRHVARITELTQGEVVDFVHRIYSMLHVIDARASEYGKVENINVVFHSAPFYNNDHSNGKKTLESYYHMHVEISTAKIPRRTTDNYELPGSGISVSKMRPKDTARELRI